MRTGVRRARRLIAFSVVAMLLGATACLVGLRRGSESSTAVHERRAIELSGAADAGTEVDAGLRPPAGTWKYRGRGSEHLSLLGGASHEFPDIIWAVTALDARDACEWRFDPVFIEEHVERRTFCTNYSGTVERTTERVTRFLGYEQTSRYRCDEQGVRLRPGGKVETTTSWSCRERRGSLVRFTSRIVDANEVIVLENGARLQTTHVRITGMQRNSGRGDERTDLWLLDTGLPARMRTVRSTTAKAGPLGTMRLREQYDYVLVSDVPAARSARDQEGDQLAPTGPNWA